VVAAVGGVFGRASGRGRSDPVGGRLRPAPILHGARVAALAQASEVLVIGTVQMLVLGPGIGFADRGSHKLKGVPDRWRLFAVEHT